MSHIGRPVRRIEDRPLLTGQGGFAADLSFDGQLHMRILRSPVAHGRLRSVDTAAAAALPGVAAVWTGADVEALPPIDFRHTQIPGLERFRQRVLARDRVRYVGDPIAAVFADDPYRAEDAAELITLDIEELESCRAAAGPPGEFAPGVSGDAATLRKGYGDVEAALARADRIIELRLEVGRHSAVPLETRGALAVVDEAGCLRLYGAAKVPLMNRGRLARMLGLPLERLHVHEAHVGGGFGVRGEVYPEDPLVCLAALRLGRPVKWIEDRREHMLAANQSRDQLHHIRAGIDRRGVVLGLDAEFWTDQGGYVRTHGVRVSDITTAFLPGPYLVPDYRVAGHVRLTNKTPAGSYRAPGRYEASFVRERLMDAIAHALGLDPAEARRRNLIPAAAMPFDRRLDALGVEVEFDSGDYAALLDRLLARIDYARLRGSLAARRDAGERVGCGFGVFVEKSGLGPFDDVRIAIDRNGDVEVVTGVASIGQGVETAMAQICADALGAPLDRITVVHGQTDRIERGMGAFASRVTVMTGSAVHLAATALKARLVEAAAATLQTRPEALEAVDGMIQLRGAPLARGLTMAAAVRERAAAGESALVEKATFDADHMTYPYGVHFVVARVDPETAGVVLERFVVAYDVGRAINPVLVEGQIAGGAAQGIGGALLEEFIYDEAGQPLATSLMDYLLPTVEEVPDIEAVVSETAPSPLNPLGVKGAGEAGIAAAGAAIAAAVEQAIGRPGAIARLPITPSRLHEILRQPPDEAITSTSTKA